MPQRLRTGLRWGYPELLSLILLSSSPAAAVPHPKDDLHDAGYGYLMPRDCNQYCGYKNMYCCPSGQQCYTSNGIAGCQNTAAGGGYNFYTTTWTLTETFTSTYSSLFPAATAPAQGTCVPQAGTGQIACGSICCASWQYCAYAGQCSANAGAGWGGATTATPAPAPTQTTYFTTYTSSGVVVTTPYSAPFRVTSGGATVTTGTALGATSTVAVTGSSTSSSLSGGAIAGIVIGTLAGIALLIAFCACVLVRGLWHGLLAIFGLGPRRRERREEDVTIIEEERYRRSSSAGGRADRHDGWFGAGRPPRPPPPVSEKRKSSGGGWLGLGAAAGTLLLLLGLRRHDKNRDRQRPLRARSDISSAYYSGSYTSTGISSGDSRRSRGTRGSRRTDPSRVSRASRPSRQSRHSRQTRRS